MTITDNIESAPSGPVSDDAFAEAMSAFELETNSGLLAVAVSGGPDSMALLLLAQAWAGERGYEIAALTVDHDLRDASAEEARQVSEWLASRGVKHHTLVWSEGQRVRSIDRSPQTEARDGRFALMAEWCTAHGAHALLLAHHADDQIETFFDRLLRGSGVDGLAAIAADTTRGGLRVLRPLLAFDKNALISTCDAHGQAWISDPSNSDESFKRVRIRHLIANLEQEGLDRDRILKTVGHMQRAKSAIDQAVDDLESEAVAQSGQSEKVLIVDEVLQAPEEVGLRFLARTLMTISGGIYPTRFDGLERVYRALATTDWSDRTLHGCHLKVRNGRLHVSREPKRK